MENGHLSNQLRFHDATVQNDNVLLFCYNGMQSYTLYSMQKKIHGFSNFRLPPYIDKHIEEENLIETDYHLSSIIAILHSNIETVVITLQNPNLALIAPYMCFMIQ